MSLLFLLLFLVTLTLFAFLDPFVGDLEAVFGDEKLVQISLNVEGQFEPVGRELAFTLEVAHFMALDAAFKLIQRALLAKPRRKAASA